MTIQMPQAAIPPSKNLSSFQFLLAGTKKIGKTSFCAQFPNHIILEFEAGNAKHLHCRYIDIGDWSSAMGVIEYLEKNPNYCDVIVVDGVQACYEIFVNKVIEDLKINDPSEKAHGAAWGTIGRHFGRYLNRLQALGKGIIYTAHTETKYYTNINGVEVSKIETNLGKRANDLMQRYTHLWAVMGYRKGDKREIIIAGDEGITAGNGFENHFKLCGRSIPMGNSAAEAFKNFMSAWNNQPISSSTPKIRIGNQS